MFRPLLLREYIHQALYHPKLGYFSKSIPPILQHRIPLNFPSFANRSEYQNAVASTYGAHQHGWMTPVELFSPHLSHAIANRIRAAAPPSGIAHVVEIGPGRATLARDILSYLSQHDPTFMSRLRYTLLEVSPTLSRLQSITVAPWVNSGVAQTVCADAHDWFAQLCNDSAAVDAHYHIIATEVLDNLAHDLVRIAPDGTILQGYIHVDRSDGSIVNNRETRSLHWQSALDVETAAAIDAFNIGRSAPLNLSSWSVMSTFRSILDQVVTGGTEEVWVPTVCYSLLRAIVTAVPFASFTVADFTSFPGALQGRLAPVVQSVRGGTAVVYDSVQNAPFGQVDIMFPSDFFALADAHRSLVDSHLETNSAFNRSIISQSEFFTQFTTTSGISKTMCCDGYNPVLHDFNNTAFLLIDVVNDKCLSL